MVKNFKVHNCTSLGFLGPFQEVIRWHVCDYRLWRADEDLQKIQITLQIPNSRAECKRSISQPQNWEHFIFVQEKILTFGLALALSMSFHRFRISHVCAWPLEQNTWTLIKTSTVELEMLHLGFVHTEYMPGNLQNEDHTWCSLLSLTKMLQLIIILQMVFQKKLSLHNLHTAFQKTAAKNILQIESGVQRNAIWQLHIPPYILDW